MPKGRAGHRDFRGIHVLEDDHYLQSRQRERMEDSFGDGLRWEPPDDLGAELARVHSTAGIECLRSLRGRVRWIVIART